MYTNIFLVRELKGSFENALSWRTCLPNHLLSLCTLFCFVCVCVCLCVCVLNLSLMSHFHNGEWKQMTNVSPQKTWFVKPFVSEELALRVWNLEWGEGWIMSCRPLGRDLTRLPSPPPPQKTVFCLNGFSGGLNLPVYLSVSADKSYTFPHECATPDMVWPL